jgi:hypothetical protein
MWDPDRLHFSPLGQHTIAMMVLDTLNITHTLQPMTPKDLPERRWREARTDDLVWAREHLFPWVLQRLKQRIAEEDRHAKRPDAGPCSPPGCRPGHSLETLPPPNPPAAAPEALSLAFAAKTSSRSSRPHARWHAARWPHPLSD